MSLFDSLQDKLENTHSYSGYFVSLCPFHDDSSPSFFVYEDSDKKSMEYQCRACGAHGSLAYLDKYLGSHHRRTLTQSHSKPVVLPRWRRWEQEYGDLEGIANHAHNNLLRHKGYQTYFKKRGIDEYIGEGTLGYLDGWYVFPVSVPDGKIGNIVVRSSSHKGVSRYVIAPVVDNDCGLYCPSWKKVLEAQTIYVVYGIVDSWSIHSLNLPVVTGITGKSLSADLLKPLNKRYIIVPDLGEEREAYNLANKLGWRAIVKKLDYPENTKDSDDIRITFGNQYLLNLLGA